MDLATQLKSFMMSMQNRMSTVEQQVKQLLQSSNQSVFESSSITFTSEGDFYKSGYLVLSKKKSESKSFETVSNFFVQGDHPLSI